MSVRQTLEDYASGVIGIAAAEQQLRTATWRPTRRSDAAMLSGVRDTPPPLDDSPDWIQIVAGLTDADRATFTRIYDDRRR